MFEGLEAKNKLKQPKNKLKFSVIFRRQKWVSGVYSKAVVDMSKTCVFN
jgi:hypothetical protein